MYNLLHTYLHGLSLNAITIHDTIDAELWEAGVLPSSLKQFSTDAIASGAGNDSRHVDSILLKKNPNQLYMSRGYTIQIFVNKKHCRYDNLFIVTNNQMQIFE